MLTRLHGLRVYRLYSLIKQRLVTPPSLRSNTGRPELKTMLKNDGRDGVEHRNAKTREPLIVHKGNLWGDRFLTNRPNAEVVDLLQKGFRNILEVTEKHNIRLIFLTYAGFGLPGRNAGHRGRINLINEKIRNFGRKHKLTLVDVKDRFVELIPKGASRVMYFLNERESHPNPAGYFEVATLVANDFEPDAEFDAHVNILIDLGTPVARKYLRSGWSMDQKNRYGTRLVLAEGKKSTMKFSLPEAREIRLIFRCVPFQYTGSATQTISFTVNREKIEQIISLEPRFVEYQIVLPRHAIVPGKKRLDFHYGYSRVVKEVRPGKADMRSSAVCWDYIHLVDQTHDQEGK